MLRRDYLMSQIEQLSKVLAQMVLRLTGIDPKGRLAIRIEQVIEETQKETGLDLDWMTKPLDAPPSVLEDERMNDTTLDLILESMYTMALQLRYEDRDKATLLINNLIKVSTFWEDRTQSASFGRIRLLQRAKSRLQDLNDGQ